MEQNKNIEQNKNSARAGQNDPADIENNGVEKMVNALHHVLSFASVAAFVFLMCHVVSLAA